MSRSERSLWMMAVIALLLGFIALGPSESGVNTASPNDDVVSIDDHQVAGPAAENPSGSGTESVQGDVHDPGAPGAGREALKCSAGRNGGATDRGVTEREIRLATTMAQSGPAASLLSDSIKGIRAVINKVNQAGGICGRELKLRSVDDGFDAQLGQQFIRNFIEEDYFALPVVPSAEGLGAAISSGYISRAGIPVVGSDGMRVEQYQDPWVWPVATATVSTMRIIADYAYHVRAARTFAIVWDSKYQFGREGADAFKQQVGNLRGGRIVQDTRLDPARNSFATEVQNFNRTCGNAGCDMVALLLLPDTAATWMKSQPAFGGKYTAGAQTLFNKQFAQDCVALIGVECNGVAAWTGYNPPVGTFRGLPGVDEYVNDVRAIDPGVDVDNQFLQGAYLGMSVFVEALRRVGPGLTRQRLRAEMDAMDFKSDLASTLRWRPGNHAANIRARGFSIVYQSGSFRGWRDDDTGFRADPRGGP